MEEVIGPISALIVFLSAIPYGWRVFQRKIQPNVVGWSIWSFIGLTLLITYDSSGAKDNIWPAVFGFTNPCLITILAVWRGERKWPEWFEIVCLVFGVSSLTMWWFMRNEPSLAQYALYMAMIADTWALVPTVVMLWRRPELDRPMMWWLFGFGYGLGIFAITDHTIANYSLPVYMFATGSLVACILAAYRIKNRIPLREWI